MLDKTASKSMHKDKEGNQQRKKTLNELMPVGNINKNL